MAIGALYGDGFHNEFSPIAPVTITSLTNTWFIAEFRAGLTLPKDFSE
jgi:hypothetical protein